MQKEQVSEGGSAGQAVVGSPPNASTANSEAAKKFLEKNENGGGTTRKKKTREVLISHQWTCAIVKLQGVPR